MINMKKTLLIIYIIIALIFIPTNINALEIEKTEISGTTESNIGEEFSLDYNITFPKTINKNQEGIWQIKYELIYDPNILIISEITSQDFDSYIYKEDNKFYIISDVIENSESTNICSNKVLYCGDYNIKIKFFIKETELTETTIKIKDTQIGLLKPNIQNTIYKLTDQIITNKQEESIHTIKINKSTIGSIEEPNEIVQDTKPLLIEEKRIDNQKIENSAFIKTITIKDYKIDFEKNKTNYNITIPQGINELDIDITLEDETSTYKIIGADDLKSNNNEIAIIVTSKNNEIITYTINIKYEKQKEETKKIDIQVLIDKYLTKDNLSYAAIVIGIIIIIILLILLKNKRENKKINKLLGEL